MTTESYPLTVTLQKTGQDWYSVHGFEKFDLARDFILKELREHKADRAIMSATSPGDNAIVELHYRAFDDPQRGRTVLGGVATAEDADQYMKEVRESYARKVFSPSELFELKGIDKYPAGSLFGLEKYLREDGIDLNYQTWEKIEAEGRIDMRFLVSEDMGSDETLEIATVRFIPEEITRYPVLICTHAGEDEAMRYIVNADAFARMISYLRSFADREEDQQPYVTDMDASLPALTEFNGYTIHDWYDVEKQKAREDNPHTALRSR